MSKWEHLVEAEDRLRKLEKKALVRGTPQAYKNYLLELKRLRKLDDVIDDNKEEILKSMARALFVSEYVNRAEEEEDDFGLDTPGFGGDWMDVAPNTPRSAMQSAVRLAKQIMSLNGLSMSALYYLASNISGYRYKEPDPEDFGYSIAMQAVGHGVSWKDNHPDPKIKIPNWYYSWFPGDN